jgi:hypothetical protein
MQIFCWQINGVEKTPKGTNKKLQDIKHGET